MGVRFESCNLHDGWMRATAPFVAGLKTKKIRCTTTHIPLCAIAAGVWWTHGAAGHAPAALTHQWGGSIYYSRGITDVGMKAWLPGLRANRWMEDGLE